MYYFVLKQLIRTINKCKSTLILFIRQKNLNYFSLLPLSALFLIYTLLYLYSCIL